MNHQPIRKSCIQRAWRVKRCEHNDLAKLEVTLLGRTHGNGKSWAGINHEILLPMGPLLVVLVTMLQAGRLRGSFSDPGVRMKLSFLGSVEISLVSHSAFRSVGSSSSSGVQQSRCEADCCPPYGVEVKCRWTCTFLLPSWRAAW
jgi:hypothetical protein